MILDDGGDATLLVLFGARAENDHPSSTIPVERGGRGAVRRDQAAGWRRIRLVLKIRDSIRGVTEETTTGVHRLYELQRQGRLPFPCHQRQRQRHQVEIRQQIRLPRISRRCHSSRHRCDACRQARGRLRLWRCRQGFRTVVARLGRPRRRHRNRSDLRSPGRHGGFRGRSPRDQSSIRPTFSSPPPAIATSSPSTTCAA